MSNQDFDASDFADMAKIEFPDPIEYNGDTVSEIMLVRQPTGADLGRFTVLELFEGNVRAIQAITPKICQPYLSPKIIKEMGARNMMALTAGFAVFFEGVDFDTMVRRADQPKTTKPAAGSGPKAG